MKDYKEGTLHFNTSTNEYSVLVNRNGKKVWEKLNMKKEEPEDLIRPEKTIAINQLTKKILDLTRKEYFGFHEMLALTHCLLSNIFMLGEVDCETIEKYMKALSQSVQAQVKELRKNEEK